MRTGRNVWLLHDYCAIPTTLCYQRRHTSSWLACFYVHFTQLQSFILLWKTIRTFHQMSSCSDVNPWKYSAPLEFPCIPHTFKRLWLNASSTGAMCYSESHLSGRNMRTKSRELCNRQDSRKVQSAWGRCTHSRSPSQRKYVEDVCQTLCCTINTSLILS